MHYQMLTGRVSSPGADNAVAARVQRGTVRAVYAKVPVVAAPSASSGVVVTAVDLAAQSTVRHQPAFEYQTCLPSLTRATLPVATSRSSVLEIVWAAHFLSASSQISATCIS